MSFYNVFFTSLPVIALGVFDQDVSATLCLKVLNYCPSLGFIYKVKELMETQEETNKDNKKPVVALA